jgi:hypothetical protein
MGGKIVHGTRDFDIWAMDENGADQRFLTPPEHDSRNPAVSPDGRCVFFESWRNGNYVIGRIGTDGSDAMMLPNGGIGVDRWPDVHFVCDLCCFCDYDKQSPVRRQVRGIWLNTSS